VRRATAFAAIVVLLVTVVAGGAVVSGWTLGGDALPATATNLATHGPITAGSAGSGAAPATPATTPTPASPRSTPSTAVADPVGTTTSITSTTYQESSSLISYAGTWSRAAYSKFSGGYVRWAKTAGASATFRFTGVSVAWIGPKGPTRGKAKVYVNGRYVKTVDLYASTFYASRVLYSASFSSQYARTLKIVVMGTAGRPVVAIDAFVVRRAVTTSTAPPPPSSDGYPGNTTLKYLATTALGRPSYLSPQLDPTLGTRTIRVSNSSGIRHAYSRLSAWNCDGSKILLGFSYPGRMLNGRTLADLGSFSQISQAIWSNVDPNKLYGVRTNSLYSQNATSAAITRLQTFSAYASINIGNGEGGISDDDRFIALIGTTSTGARHLITYDLVARAVVGDIVSAGSINNAQISRKGNYVVVVNDTDGPARGQGVERYTRDLSSRINLTPYGRHGDNALDANGNEIFVSNNAPSVVAFNLATGAGTRLLPATTAFEYGHVSGRNLARPGWIYLSVFNNSITAGRAGHDQVIAVKTDGSGTVEVFAFSHHTNTTTYAMQPHAVPSPDGRRVLFASEWGSTSVLAYVAGL
jgi:hypothetical protein